MPRDYKHAAGPGEERPFPALVLLITGIVIGWGLSEGIDWLQAHHRGEPGEMPTISDLEKKRDEADGGKTDSPDDTSGDEKGPRFDFYRMLKDFEVMVPERDVDVSRDDKPTEKVEKPGTYVLQVGSFRKAADADRRKAELALLGIEARIQRVRVDGDAIWHRVRIGPITDTDELNAVRKRLAANDIDALMIRVSDEA